MKMTSDLLAIIVDAPFGHLPETTHLMQNFNKEKKGKEERKKARKFCFALINCAMKLYLRRRFQLQSWWAAAFFFRSDATHLNQLRHNIFMIFLESTTLLG